MLGLRATANGNDVFQPGAGRLHGALAAAQQAAPRDFAELLLVPGVGARTVESLALVAEVIFGAPARFDDPARFSYAHGGKDGHPFPVPLDVYDRTLSVLTDAVSQAKLNNDDRMAALKRLNTQAAMLEAGAKGLPLEQMFKQQAHLVSSMGGRSVGTGSARTSKPQLEPPKPKRARKTTRAPKNDTGQLKLF